MSYYDDDISYVNIETTVADCCGLHAIFDLPEDFKKFKRSLVQDRSEFPYHEGKNFKLNYGKGMRGAFVMCTTAQFQKKQEKYLTDIGFNNVGKEKNTNSGNFVTVWLIPCKKLDELLDKWTEELSSEKGKKK